MAGSGRKQTFPVTISKASREEEMRVGDRISVNGHACTVVALLADKTYAPAFPPEEWSYLETGILVEDDGAGVIHYADLTNLHIESLNGQ